MIRAYDDNGNVIRCAECKFYNKKDAVCLNDKNAYRGSGNEYSFSIKYIGDEENLLTAEKCDNWFCADFEVKERR